MRKIDELYTAYPHYGSRRMVAHLQREGHRVNRKRVRGLMEKMGLVAVYPKPKTSLGCEGHEKYPYLLRGLSIDEPDHVWSSDITYLPMREGYMYLVAVIDWGTRYVITWELSNSLQTSFCTAALEQALSLGKPLIFNTDQGAQFTSKSHTNLLKQAGVQISMDGRGRALDNVYVERLWRSVKYEEVYLKEYETVPDLRRGLEDYFWYYNHERPHQSLGYATPAEVYNKNLAPPPMGGGVIGRKKGETNQVGKQ